MASDIGDFQLKLSCVHMRRAESSSVWSNFLLKLGL